MGKRFCERLGGFLLILLVATPVSAASCLTDAEARKAADVALD